MNKLPTFPYEQVKNLVSEISREYKDINAGGCGLMASYIGQFMEPIVGTDNVMIAICNGYDSPQMSYQEIKQKCFNNSLRGANIRQFNKYNFWFNHVWVEFLWNNDMWSMDATNISKGMGLSGWKEPHQIRATVEDITVLAENPIGWNSWFNREHAPQIKTKLVNGLTNILISNGIRLGGIS